VTSHSLYISNQPRLSKAIPVRYYIPQGNRILLVQFSKKSVSACTAHSLFCETDIVPEIKVFPVFFSVFSTNKVSTMEKFQLWSFKNCRCFLYNLMLEISYFCLTMLFNENFPHKRNNSARCKNLRKKKKKIAEYFPSFNQKPNEHINGFLLC